MLFLFGACGSSQALINQQWTWNTIVGRLEVFRSVGVRQISGRVRQPSFGPLPDGLPPVRCRGPVTGKSCRETGEYILTAKAATR